MSTQQIFRVGLIGWGLAGRYFHAPFIKHTPGLELTTVVTSRQPDRGLFPNLKVLDDPDTILRDPEIDLVVVASPNRMHVPQAMAALQAGKHVVLEKPVAETAVQFQKLIAAANAADRLLIPFQNRRWDGDFMTVQQVVASGLLGKIHYYASSWEKYRPIPKPRTGWKAEQDHMNGLLYDLGPHLIDQAITLFGTPDTVYAQVQTRRPGGYADDFFHIHLRFPSGVDALLQTDQLNPFPAPRFHLRGQYGAFEKFGLDPQEERLVAGEMPDMPEWGQEPSADWGKIKTTAGVGAYVEGEVATVPGSYLHFYRRVHRALSGKEPVPVDPASVVLQLRIIETALASAQSGRVHQLDT